MTDDAMLAAVPVMAVSICGAMNAGGRMSRSGCGARCFLTCEKKLSMVARLISRFHERAAMGAENGERQMPSRSPAIIPITGRLSASRAARNSMRETLALLSMLNAAEPNAVEGFGKRRA